MAQMSSSLLRTTPLDQGPWTQRFTGPWGVGVGELQSSDLKLQLLFLAFFCQGVVYLGSLRASYAEMQGQGLH